MIASWPCPGGDELALACDRGRPARLLILPALFDEANKLRHFTAAAMRLLDAAGVDSLLPDLPGCNESPAPVAAQSLSLWREAARAAAAHFAATHVLTVRAAALVVPPLPGWRYAPQDGPATLRALLRARLIAAREAGLDESREALLEQGRREGLDLAGYRLGPAMIAELEAAPLPASSGLADIPASALGGPGLWLRAEPGHDPAQAQALAALLAARLAP